MKIKTLAFLLACTLAVTIPSCKKDDSSSLKIGLLSYGSFNDGDFNQSAMNGFSQATHEFDFISETKECLTTGAIDSALSDFCDRDFDLVIGIGYFFADPIHTAAVRYPGTDFMILDVGYDTIPANVMCATYAIDQVSYPAGVLAAWQALKDDPEGPVAGFVAGPDTSVMNQFARPFENGVKYFNQQFGKEVGFTGRYAGNFADSLQGVSLATDLIVNQGVDVLYAFAGFTGTGALAAASAQGIVGIGVDVDQYYSLPAIRQILLTSCMKRLDNTVYSVIGDYVSGHFAGGTNLVNNLNNSGVSLAPFHDFEFVLPDSIKTLVAGLLDDIRNGKVSTGWR